MLAINTVNIQPINTWKSYDKYGRIRDNLYREDEFSVKECNQ